MKKKISVFISYAHEDEAALKNLKFELRDSDYVDVWNDRNLMPGEDWNRKIVQMLDEANVALFLVSKAFIDSTYIREVEIRNIVKRSSKSCYIIGIILEPVPVDQYVLSEYQSLPQLDKPMSTFPDPEKAWLVVVSGIQRVLLNIVASYRQLEKENLHQPAQLSSKIALAMTLLTGLIGAFTMGIGIIQKSVFYVSVAAVCICLCFAGFLIIQRALPFGLVKNGDERK